jgi:RNA polymerase sigma-70 factor (ECF subfamily)
VSDRSQPYENEALFRRFAAGDHAAFDEIYYRHAATLLTTATRKLGSQEKAKEIVQEVFVKLFLSRQDVQHFDNIGGYLSTILKRKIINQLRDELIHQRHHIIYQNNQREVDDLASSYTEYKELDTKIHMALTTLPPQCKQAFILSRYENLSYREIAEKMEISIKTVEMHISNALKILRTELKDYQLLLMVIALQCFPAS